jgi:hypothetical protein
VSRRKNKLSGADVIKNVRAAYVSLWTNRVKGSDKRRVKVSLWGSKVKESDKLNDNIKKMLNQSDPIVKSVLRYILFLRSKHEDVEIQLGSSYDPITGSLSHKPSKFILTAATSTISSHWLYFYMPEVKDFTVLRMSKKSMAEEGIQKMSSKAVVLYTEPGKAYHYVGINKIKKFMANKKEPVKIKFIKVKINYKLLDIVGNNLELPCITEGDFEQHKKFYRCLLRDLGIIPPLIVELPPNDVGGQPGIGLILPIKYSEKRSNITQDAVRTYILPLHTLPQLRMDSFRDFINSLKELERKQQCIWWDIIDTVNIKCISLVKYLYGEKYFGEFLKELMEETGGLPNLLPELLPNDTNNDEKLKELLKELKEPYVELVHELRKYNSKLDNFIEHIFKSTNNKGRKYVIHELLDNNNELNVALFNDNIHVIEEMLGYLPNFDVVRIYDLDYIKRISKALLCLKDLV